MIFFCLLYFYSLESAGDGGFIVSGLMQSEGDGERSRFVIWPRPRERPVEWPNESERCPKPVECPRWLLWRPSEDMQFSDRNSSRSTYCNENKYEILISEILSIKKMLQHIIKIILCLKILLMSEISLINWIELLAK